MQRRLAIIAVALSLMMAAPMLFVVDVDADTDTSVSHGEFDIYLRSSTSAGVNNAQLANITTSWLKFDVEGYDACKAVMNLNTNILSLSKASYSINNTFDVELENEYGTYYDVDPNYGQIDKMLKLSNNDSMKWHAWAYVITGTNGSWTEVNLGAGLGHYRPFNDYVNDHESANIALFYGTDAQAATAVGQLTNSPTQALVDMTQMKAAGVSDYQVTVTIKDSTVVNGSQYVVQNVVGYGSDVFAALKDVCQSNNLNIVGNDIAGPYYSWLTSIDDKANAVSSPWTPYWAFFDNSASGPVYTSYVSGYYSPLAEGYHQTSSVLFTYGSGSP